MRLSLPTGDGKIRLWNGGAERIFGYEESEALGSTLDLIVPERFRERHWEGYQRVVETGKPSTGTGCCRCQAFGGMAAGYHWSSPWS